MSKRFPKHTVETAPEASRERLREQASKFGFLASPLATMAHSPQTLEAALTLFRLFEETSLSPAQREVVAMTLAYDRGCTYCVAMHSRIVSMMPALAPELDALRAGRAPSDPQLAALSIFVRVAASSHGDVGDHAFVAFLAAGYTEKNALEVTLGIAAYTLSITSNHLTEVEVDPPFWAHRWEKHG
ncbi:MAG: carboxymuconolactone decarboxylase family protein [Polyangiaceae bacterium]|nr:carboxymuconolactone decarboxylase family protein [Polyangiaceae bacterium]